MRRPLQTFHTPLRATWDVAGDPTETVWWPPQQDSVPKTILFFIPGNPGLVEYYTDFLETIYRAASPSLEIYGVSHLGHSTGPHTKYQKDPDRLYSLHEQIQHKIRCFDILRSENAADTKFILMGHSIGAYICAEVLKKRQDQGIERLIALFPTLREIALTPNGVSISRLISTLPKSILPTAASGLSLLAAPVRQRLVGLFTGQSGSSLEVTAHQLLRASVVRNALYMAQHEMETVKELDHDFYDAHVDKFVLYYSKNDEWAPLDHYDYMKAKFPNHQHIYLCEQNLPHAFILDHKHADYMAKKVVAWISA